MIDNNAKIFLDIDENFIKEWLDRAKSDENKDSDLTQFFCYFIVFNYLYSSLWYQNKKIVESVFSGSGERMMINFLIEYYYPTNQKTQVESPYRLLNENSELRKYVYSMNSDTKNSIKQKYQKLLDEEDINQLFQNIYTVRCNLFHGSKSMLICRNKQLLNESNKVLADFLNKVVSNHDFF